MKHFFLAVFFGLLLSGTSLAGDLTNGVRFTGGENSLAGIVLSKVQDDSQGNLTLQVSISDAKNLKGCAFVLQYNPLKYEFVKASNLSDNLFNSDGDQPLFFANNKRGQVITGTMGLDGSVVTGDGVVAEYVFKSVKTPNLNDFQIVDGVMVDLSGDTDAIFNIDIVSSLTDNLVNKLGQNVPNPFNPATIIEYNLKESGEVKLIVYNLLGQQVRALVSQHMDAGYHSAIWNGQNELGRQVASGIYIYQLSAGNFTQAKRMVLLK